MELIRQADGIFGYDQDYDCEILMNKRRGKSLVKLQKLKNRISV